MKELNVNELREFDIGSCKKEDVGDGWKEIIGDREVKEIIYCEFGVGEECIGFMKFEDGSYEVGVGECLRGYYEVSKGDDLNIGSMEFLNEVYKHL